MVNGTMDNVQPPGLYQRFLKFFMNKLVPRGITRVTLGGRESVEVPIEAPSRNGSNSVLKPSPKPNGEIVVEFRHIEPVSKKNATPVQESGERNRGEGNGSIDTDIVIIHHQPIKVADEKTITMAPRPKPPSSIDQKADDYIRSRKEAMIKHYNSS